MRRLIRDKLYRGRGTGETFDFFRSVERGENLYIMPFKYRADFDIDTFLPYEPLIYRDILLPDLEKAAGEYADYAFPQGAFAAAPRHSPRKLAAERVYRVN